MKNVLIFAFTFISCMSNAQNTLQQQVKVEMEIDNIVKKQLPVLDSIFISDTNLNMKIIRHENIYEASGYVSGNKNLLTLNYYLVDDKLIAVKTKEINPNMTDVYKQWIFKYSKYKIVNEFTSYSLRSGIQINPDYDFNKMYGYNENWTASFMKNLVSDLYKKIKNYR